MRSKRSTNQPRRRSTVFRLRPLASRPPFGQRAFQAHGHASLPSLQVRSDDVLCVSTDLARGAVLVLEPQSPGHPMLGHRSRGELRSLPADLPCSDSLWQPVGSVAAVWRRGLSSIPADIGVGADASPAVGLPHRAVCIRVPQAALALVRAERPELMSAQLRAASQPGGDVLVFPGAAAAARPVAQASMSQLRELAQQLAQALGSTASVQSVSASELCVTARLPVDLAGADRLARSLSRRLRLPLALAVADSADAALSAASSLGADQLLWVLPPTPRAESRRPSAAAVRPVLVPPPVPTWSPAVPAPRRRSATPAAASESVQLGLFERSEAA